VSSTGVTHFVLHARSAILGGGVSTRQNLAVPKLDYDRVSELARMFPNNTFTINGGIADSGQATRLLEQTPSNVRSCLIASNCLQIGWPGLDSDECGALQWGHGWSGSHSVPLELEPSLTTVL
jgi:tRNA-dihydrouridine synthase